MDEPLWTMERVAEILGGCSEKTVRRLTKAGLPHVRVGGRIMFVPERVRAWIGAGGSRPTATRGSTDKPAPTYKPKAVVAVGGGNLWDTIKKARAMR